jgi:hypothetical protein
MVEITVAAVGCDGESITMTANCLESRQRPPKFHFGVAINAAFDFICLPE